MLEYFGLDYFFDNTKRIYFIYIFSALLLSLIFMSKYLRIQFSKKVLFHPSARLDYIYFLAISLIKILIIIPLLLNINDVVLWIVLALQEHFGYQERIRTSKFLIIFFYTLVVFIANDFSRYLLHRAMHSFALLWRFHRIHHSAEVLNFLTFYRVHPIENILFGLRYALVTGFVMGVFIYFFGAGIQAIELLGVHVISFFFMLFGANLRHSHIPLRFGNTIEKWILSPFQHQLHHTPEHLDANFGSSLAIWDRLFATLTITDIHTLRFGLANQSPRHSLWGALLNPFYKGIKL